MISKRPHVLLKSKIQPFQAEYSTMSSPPPGRGNPNRIERNRSLRNSRVSRRAQRLIERITVFANTTTRTRPNTTNTINTTTTAPTQPTQSTQRVSVDIAVQPTSRPPSLTRSQHERESTASPTGDAFLAELNRQLTHQRERYLEAGLLGDGEGRPLVGPEHDAALDRIVERITDPNHHHGLRVVERERTGTGTGDIFPGGGGGGALHLHVHIHDGDSGRNGDGDSDNGGEASLYAGGEEVYLDELEEGEKCGICLMAYSDDTEADVVRLPCQPGAPTHYNHVFHRDCIRDWLRQSRTCPACRRDIE